MTVRQGIEPLLRARLPAMTGLVDVTDHEGGNRAVLLPGETVTCAGTAVVPGGSAAGPRVLLLVPARTYRAADFLAAACRMGLDLVVGSDGALPLGDRPVIPVNPDDPDASVRRILARGPVAAVVAADTPMLILAGAAAARMGLPHNPVDAVLNATDKARQRRRWRRRAAQPQFEIVPAAAPRDAICQAAEAVGFPCVVKAVSLSASQGILRADDPEAAVTAAHRIRQVLAAARRPAGEPLLVEGYLPGPELSIDGLLAGGNLTPVAIFDKPRTPDGPTFEETLLVTPSRLPAPVLAAAIGTAGQAARALGLSCGPVHAELRIDDRDGQAGPPCSNWRRAASVACAHARCGFPAARPWRSSCWPARWAGTSPRPARSRADPPACSCFPCRARACSAR